MQHPVCEGSVEPAANGGELVCERARCLQFSLWYTSHYAFVRAAVRRAGIPAADVEDAAQDVFCVLLRRMAALDTQAKLHAWLLVVTSYVCRNRRRSRKRRSKWVDEAHSGVELEDSYPDRFALSPHARYERRQLAELVLGGLDSAQREVLLLTALEGWTAREIARHLDVSPNTVSSRLRAAREKNPAAALEQL